VLFLSSRPVVPVSFWASISGTLCS
jgi:hypothetical protein